MMCVITGNVMARSRRMHDYIVAEKRIPKKSSELDSQKRQKKKDFYGSRNERHATQNRHQFFVIYY